jgi:hypothetical protein
MKTKHGVLTNEGLLTIQGNNWQTVPMARDNTLLNLMLTCTDYELTHLWIHPETGIEPHAPLPIEQGTFKGIVENWDLLGHTRGTHIKSVTGWQTDKKGSTARVIFPHHSGWGQTGRITTPGWGKLANGKQLLVTIAYLEKKLGVPIGASPGSTGWELHKKMHPDWVENFPRVNLDTMHFREGARDMAAQSPYTKGKYLHKVDKNSAYLAACTLDMFYGVGDPVLDEDGSKYLDGSKKDGHRPGTWYCSITPGEILLPNWEKAQKHWLATPMIRLMRKVGYEVVPHLGWYFPQCHQLLEKWALFIWETREFFATADSKEYRRRDCCEFARQACKQIAVETVGLTSYLQFGEEEETDKRRPDIKAETVARNYELMWYNIMKFHQQTGKKPILVYMDALYYISDEPTLTGNLAQILARQNQLGGFKYEGTIEISPEVAEILNAKTNVSKKLEHLNKIGWKK